MGLPSTQMVSVSGSALVPSSVMTWPWRVTRPAVMISSALRREAMPAEARIFWRRVSIGEEDNSDQRTDSRIQVSLEEYFTMRFGWVRGKRKDNAEARRTQRLRREENPRTQAEACATGAKELLAGGVFFRGRGSRCRCRLLRCGRR